MIRLLLAVLFGAVVLLGAAPASAASIAQPPPTTAPAGPQLDQPTEADAKDSKTKLIVGITAIVLTGIVVYGNRVRAKRNK